MSNAQEMDNFVALSTILTGIAANKLAPNVDPTNVKQSYFDIAQQEAGQTFQEMLARYSALKSAGKSNDQIATDILHNSGTAIGNTARSVMAMWYLGSWYPADGSAPHVVSANAYTQGWAWRVAQAHPMGFSQLRYGYWRSDPPPLKDFVGNGG